MADADFGSTMKGHPRETECMAHKKPLVGILILLVFNCHVVLSTASAQITSFDFAEPVFIDLPEDLSPTCFDFADLDDDGDLDAVAVGRNTDGRVCLLEGGPGGTLVLVGELTAPDQVDWVELGDFNEDGAIDMVLGIRAWVGMVVLFDGLSEGWFAAEPRIIRFGRELRSTRIADLNQDAHLDLVVVGHSSEEIQVLNGDGTGAFAFGSRLRTAPWRNGYPYPQSAELLDLDLDGFTDIAAIGLGSRTIELSLNDGTGGFSRTRSWKGPDLENGQQPGCSYADWQDFNGDGRVDCLLSLTDFGMQQFAILQLDETGGISTTTLHPGSSSGFSWYPASGDFDGDGDRDVVIGHALPGLIAFFENVTPPGGDPEFLYPQSFFGLQFIRYLRSVDLDLDGDADLVAADFSGDRLIVLENQLVGGPPPGERSVRTDQIPARPAPVDLPSQVREMDGSSIAKWLSDLSAREVRQFIGGSDSSAPELVEDAEVKQ